MSDNSNIQRCCDFVSTVHCLCWIYSCCLAFSVYFSLCPSYCICNFEKKNKRSLQMTFFRGSFREDLTLHPVDTSKPGSPHFNFRIDMIWSCVAVTVRAYLLLVFRRLQPSAVLNQMSSPIQWWALDSNPCAS